MSESKVNKSAPPRRRGLPVSLVGIAAGLSAIAIFAVMLVGVTDIALGEVFGFFLAFKVDMSGTLTAAAIFMTWPMVQKRDNHIRVDLFMPFFSPLVTRAQWWLSRLSGLIFAGLLTHGAWALALDSMVIWERSAATLGYPIWPAKLACAIGASLTVLVFLWQIARRLLGLRAEGEGAFL